jgi:hypothetical protein
MKKMDNAGRKKSRVMTVATGKHIPGCENRSAAVAGWQFTEGHQEHKP